jgi:hypothetical protein
MCFTCFTFPHVAITQDVKPTQPPETPQPSQPNDIERHAWAKFGVGSWKLVRISKEVFDDDGKLESVTIQEGKTTLIAVNGKRFTVQQEFTVEVAGKRFQWVPKELVRGLYNETEGQKVSRKSLRNGKVVICQREYATQIHEITVSDKKTKRVSRVYFSPNVRPFILKSNTVSTDQTSKQTNYVDTVEVLAVDMPHRVLTEVKPTAHIKTVHTQGKSTTVTIEISCLDVPGHIVAHTAKTVGANGRLTERSTLELLDYEVVSKQDGLRGLGRQRLLGKRRSRGNPR